MSRKPKLSPAMAAQWGAQQREYERILQKPLKERTVEESRLVMYHENSQLCPSVESVWVSEEQRQQHLKSFQASGLKGANHTNRKLGRI